MVPQLSSLQYEANQAANWVKNKADGFLTKRTHAYIGVSIREWKPAGVTPYLLWLTVWLDLNFGAPYDKFWETGTTDKF